jgi:hypothetical protein
MQSDLKNVESEIIANFAGASGKLSIKFNQYSAVVLAPSSYIQAGQKYTADIFIGASSFGAHYAKHRLWFYYQDFVKEQFIKFSD